MTEELKAPLILVEEMDRLILDIRKKREEIEEASKKETELQKELIELKAIAVTFLKDLGRDSFKSSDGTISLREKWSVVMPKNQEERMRFFAHLKEKGIYDTYVTVNSQSLNAYFRAEWEEAKKRGADALMEFSIPGIEPPKVFEDISFRK